MKPEIIFATQEVIEQYDALATSFLKEMFGMTSYMISDESTLSDFAGSGKHGINPEGSLSVFYDAWDAWIKRKIFAHYRVEVVTTNILLIDLFRSIETQPALQ